MSGGGHLADMNKRIKQNRELLKGNRPYGKQRGLTSQLAHKKRKISFKKGTPEEIKSVRDTIISENRKSDIRKLRILLFVTLGSITLWMFWSWVSKIIGG